MDKSASFIAHQLIRFYQILTAGLPHRCRFWPSCSAYMQDAIRQEGIRLGLLKGITRILRCHPWHPGGWDPVAR